MSEHFLQGHAHRAYTRATFPCLESAWDDLADAFEDRVSESLVDYDDEREAVEVVLPGTIRSVN